MWSVLTVLLLMLKLTGRCRELLQKGATVFLEGSDNPLRKTKYDLVKEDGMWIDKPLPVKL